MWREGSGEESVHAADTLWSSEPFDTRCARALGGPVRLSRFLLRPLGVGARGSLNTRFLCRVT